MRSFLGILLELAVLLVILLGAYSLASLYPLSVLILLLAQLSTTVLIHCPAHYAVGRAFGIRFSRIRLGRSTAAKALPVPLKRFGSLLVVPTLSVAPESRRTARPKALRAMYLAGVLGSAGSAVLFAVAVSLSSNPLAAVAAWVFALGYLASDVKFSPISGDMMRARAVTASES